MMDFIIGLFQCKAMTPPHLHSCCHFFSLSTGSWIIAWWNVVYCASVLFVNGMLLANLNILNETEREYAEHVLIMTLVVASIQLAFTFLLLIGTYKGHRTLIFCWTVAATVLTLISLILYIMLLIEYLNTQAIFALLATLNVYCILVVASYYREVTAC